MPAQLTGISDAVGCLTAGGLVLADGSARVDGSLVQNSVAVRSAAAR